MDKIKSIISVIYSTAKFIVIKVFHNGFDFKGIQRFSPNTTIELGKNSQLVLGKKIRAHSGTKIRVRDNASVVIGNDVAFNYNCLLTARMGIFIGDGCEIGPNVMFYDHDHDYRAEGGVKAGKYKTSTVKIGKNVWIGANSVILRGADIGDGCVIGAGTIVRGGVYPANSLIVSEQNIHVMDLETKTAFK